MTTASITRRGGPTATIRRSPGVTATMARRAGAVATIALGALPDALPPLTPFVTAGLVARYAVDQGSGQTLTDATANALDGTLGSTSGADTNDPTWTSTGLQFVTDDYVRLPLAATGGTGSCTFFVVARLTGGGNYPHLFGAAPGDNGLRMLFNASTREYWLRVKNAALQSLDLVTTTPVPLNTWRCFAARFTAGSALDGWEDQATVLSGATTISDRSQGTEALLGTDGPAAAQTFPGDIAYVLTYNRALTDSEIDQTYTALKERLASRGVLLP